MFAVVGSRSLVEIRQLPPYFQNSKLEGATPQFDALYFWFLMNKLDRNEGVKALDIDFPNWDGEVLS